MLKLGKEFMPMSKDGLKLNALKNGLGVEGKKPEMCELHIKGTPEMILKILKLENKN